MEFIAQVENLPSMLGFISDQAIKGGIQGEKLGKIELAMEEALVNIIYHGYPDRDSLANKISIFCEMQDSQRFKVTLRDKGIPFNPTEKIIDLQTNVPIEERAVGGLGIYLMRQLAHEIEYERSKDENVLSLIFV